MKIVTAASGKGGVGKTTLVANLGIALAKNNHRVVLFDADLGLADLDVMLGLSSQANLQHAIDGSMSLREVMITGPAGIRVIPGSSGVGKMIRLSRKRIEEFIQHTAELESDTDFLFFDASAGADSRVMTFLRASHEVMIVATPDPASITDAYATIKVLFRYKPDAAIRIVVNMVKDEEEARRVFGVIQSITTKFLRKEMVYGGFVRKDQRAAQCVRERKAFIEAAPMTPASCDVRTVAEGLTHNSLRKAA